MQWVVRGAVDVDIGANASAEDGEDESVDDQAVKVVDIIDTFRLQVTSHRHSSCSLSAFPNGCRRQPFAHPQSDERRSHMKQAGCSNADVAAGVVTRVGKISFILMETLKMRSGRWVRRDGNSERKVCETLANRTWLRSHIDPALNE